LRAGFDHYRAKPVDPGVLASMVTALMAIGRRQSTG
jgi:hypothetical protein